MPGGLVALLDDVAALARLAAASVDDVAAAAGSAGAKTAGVVIDDAAVTPSYVVGLPPERELPIIGKIAIGSLRNKLLFILPAALLLSAFAPMLLTPILMLGGLYLSFEGAEKIIGSLKGERAVEEVTRITDAAELEARSGLPAWVLQLVSGVLETCQYLRPDGPQLVAAAVDAPQAALEAIPVGADLEAIARRHTIMMLDGCATLQDGAGSGLLPEQQALVRELSALHAADCGDAGAFRALRRRATSAADAANAGVAVTVLTFVESVAWPIAGLSAELPVIVNNAHLELRTHLAPQRATDEELAAIDAMRAAYEAIRGRQETEPGLDANAVHERWVATPEYMKVNAPEFQSRLRHYGRVAAEAYAPFAVGLLLEAFGKA